MFSSRGPDGADIVVGATTGRGRATGAGDPGFDFGNGGGASTGASLNGLTVRESKGERGITDGAMRDAVWNGDDSTDVGATVLTTASADSETDFCTGCGASTGVLSRDLIECAAKPCGR